MLLNNPVHIVRNKRELNSVLRNYRPDQYKTVHEWLELKPTMLPKRYPAALVVYSKQSEYDGTLYLFDYIYKQGAKQLATLLEKADSVNNRTTRGRRMTGTLPKDIRELSPGSPQRSVYLDEIDLKKLRRRAGKSKTVIYLNL